ncbi:MAG: hypothetical protein CMH81_06005 [Nitrospiraceae bacterium]|nr:hypothetical protein [Nitrospiraceae bacterium]
MPFKDPLALLKFRCTGCGNCCKGTAVYITPDDVHRIADGTGKTPREFIRFFYDKFLTIAKRDTFAVRFGKRRAVMGLKWKVGKCMFLGKDNMCLIYDHRPVTCRQHPFNVTLSDTGAVERLSLSRIVPCLYEMDGKVSKRHLGSLLHWNDKQTVTYEKTVKAWNKTDSKRQTRNAFLSFIGVLPSLNQSRGANAPRNTSSRKSVALPSVLTNGSGDFG